MVHKKYRGIGLGGILADMYEKVAPRLGYDASFFNLVYANNIASIRLWEKRGYTKTGSIPNAALLKSSGWTDAYQYYKKFDNEKDKK